MQFDTFFSEFVNPQSGPMRRINVYPDPFNTKVSVEVTSEEKETVIVSMINQSSRILRMFSWPLKPGTNKTSVDGLEAFPSGVYTINIKDASGAVFSNVSISKADKA